MTKIFHLLLILVAPLAHAHIFQSPMTNTHWQVVESPLECSLSQEIPGFGTASFSQHTAAEFTLAFNTQTLVKITILPPIIILRFITSPNKKYAAIMP